jgi:hypothetical protein
VVFFQGADSGMNYIILDCLGDAIFLSFSFPVFLQKPLTEQEMSEKINRNCVALKSLRFYYEK